MTAIDRTRARQRGMALIVSLILLLVLTLLGLAAMQNTSLEERMAGNLWAENRAFQAAESSLRVGENWLGAGTLNTQPATTTAKPVCGLQQVWGLDAPDPDDATELTWWLETDADWWTNNGIRDNANDCTCPPAALHCHAIEQAGFVRDSLVVGQQGDYTGRWFYQITSRGVDVGGRSEVLLRSTYARRF
jgi:type IV pilus assembly protein PilX